MTFPLSAIREQQVNHRSVHHEVQKMSAEQKEALAAQLLEDVQNSRKAGITMEVPQKEEDFENPFSTAPPQYVDRVRLEKTGWDLVISGTDGVRPGIQETLTR